MEAAAERLQPFIELLPDRLIGQELLIVTDRDDLDKQIKALFRSLNFRVRLLEIEACTAWNRSKRPR